MENVYACLRNLTCATCLSSDRRLTKDDTLVAKVLLLFPKYVELDPSHDKLCWECRAILKKLLQFHQQMLKAQNMLKDVLKGQAGVLKSLSTLKTHDNVVQSVQHSSNNTPLINVAHDNTIVPVSETPQKITNKLPLVVIKKSQCIFNKDMCIKMLPSKPKVAETNIVPFTVKTEQLVPLEISHEDNSQYKQLEIINVGTLRQRDNLRTKETKSHDFVTENSVKNSNFKTIKAEELITDVLKHSHSDVSNDSTGFDGNEVSQNIALDFDEKIFEHRISKELQTETDNCTNTQYTIKMTTSFDYSIEEEPLLTSIPILDLQHVKFPIRSKSIPILDLRHVKIVIKPSKERITKTNITRKRNRNLRTGRRQKACKNIRIHNDVSEKTLSEADMQQLREEESNSDLYQQAKFHCDKCVFGYQEEGLFKAHLNRHKKSYGSEVCTICELRFENSESLENHIKTHYRAFYCTICGFTSRFLPTIASHNLKVHGKPELFCCSQCDAQYGDVQELSQHVKIAHKPIPTCRQCGKQFKKPYMLKIHEQRVHDRKRPRIECKICHKTYADKFSHASHMKNVHKNDDKGEENSYYCSECDKFYKTKKTYEDHMALSSKHRQPSYTCDECGKNFSVKRSIKEHIITIHLKLKDFPCPECDKVFASKKILQRHKTIKHPSSDTNRKERSFVCNYCGKLFGEHSTLKTHLRIHSGQKPFQCEYCDWKFAQKSTLRTHQKFKHKDKIPTLPKIEK